MAPELVVLHTSLLRGGQVSLGTEVNVLPAAIEAVCRTGGAVIAQVNPQMPFTYGDGVLPAVAIDLMVEVDEPLDGHQPVPPDDASMAIGTAVGARVPGGATLQAGIGGVPDAALPGLTARRELRVWTGMFSDSVRSLERVGALDAGVPITTSFVFGSAELYAWLDRNERVQMTRTEVANDPSRISANPAMVSINSSLEVDLFAQADGSRVRGRIYSGPGGQADFVVGAIHSPGGQALIGLRSWHPRASTSTIAVRVGAGDVVSRCPRWSPSPRRDFGARPGATGDQPEQPRRPPDARDELWQVAGDLALKPNHRGNH